MIDAHAHLVDMRFGNLDEVMGRARTAGVEHVVMAGTEPSGWRQQAELAAGRDDVTCVFGLHPWWVRSRAATREALGVLEGCLSGDAAPRGIGETGLDRAPAHVGTLELQVESFRAHLDLARRYVLPVVLHVVRGHGLALDILRETPPPAGGVVHGFTGSLEVARDYRRLGLAISIGGWVCAPRSPDRLRAVTSIDEDALLVETDAPDPFLGDDPATTSEPADLERVIAAVAQIRDVSPAHIAEVTSRNAQRIFGLDA